MTDDAELGRTTDRTLALLWRARLGQLQRSRGPKQRVDVDAVIHAGIALADAEGLGSLSMRRVADSLGLATMSLYTYVAGRGELLALMVDEVAGESSYGPHAGSLRENMAAVARQTWDELHRHPWLLATETSRPWIGPHASARYEWQLAAIEGVGFGDVEMDQVVTLLTGFAHGAARASLRARETRDRSAFTDRQWWEVNAPVLDRLIMPETYPISVRVGRAAGETYDSIADPELAFTFGLDRILDGLEALLRRSSREYAAAPEGALTPSPRVTPS